MKEICWPTPEFPDLDTRQNYAGLLPVLAAIHKQLRHDVGEAENMDCVRYRLMEEAWTAAERLHAAIDDIVRMDNES